MKRGSRGRGNYQRSLRNSSGRHANNDRTKGGRAIEVAATEVGSGVGVCGRTDSKTVTTTELKTLDAMAAVKGQQPCK